MKPRRDCYTLAGVVSLMLMCDPGGACAQTLSRIFTVPGMTNNGATHSYVACTNNNAGPVTVGVDLFDASGGLLSSNSSILQAKETRLFGTAAAAGVFLSDVNIYGGAIQIGSAEVLASSKTRINCSAWWTSGSQGSASLSVVAKDKQKGD